MTAPPPAPTPIPGRFPALNRASLIASAVRTRRHFYHSGDLGDIIYSLATMRLLGGGDYTLGGDQRIPATHKGTRHPMTEQHAQIILPLLRLQPYVLSANWSPAMPPTVTHDFNQFRPYFWGPGREAMRAAGYPFPFSLLHAHAATFGVRDIDLEQPWLFAPPAAGAPEILISRSARYQNATFPWADLARRFEGRMAFVGLAEEHQAWCRQFDWIPYVPTADFVELARLIAGCSLFIGNQSAPYAIAEGLKKPVILETWLGDPNCIFRRKNCAHQLSNAKTWPCSIRLNGYAGTLTALDQLCTRVAEELDRRQFAVAFSPILPEAPGCPKTTARLIRSIPNPDLTLTIVSMEHLVRVSNPGVTFTLWESTRIKPKHVAMLNETERVVTFSKWNRDCFSGSGVTRDIRVIPNCLPMIYRTLADSPPRRPFVFLAGGRMAHGAIRKSLGLVVQAFVDAFPLEPDVRLRLKITPGDRLDYNDPRIEVIGDFIDELALWKFYRSGHVLVSASRAEGWGQMQQEALGVGRLLIAPVYGGLAEFWHPDYVRPVDYDIEPAAEGWTGLGDWCRPRLESLTAQMRWAYEHPEQTIAMGLAGHKAMQPYTIENTVDHLLMAALT